MKVYDTYRFVLCGGNVAVSALRRAGLPIDMQRVESTLKDWEQEMTRLEAYVEGEAANRGISLKYSPAHSTERKPMEAFLFGPKGLGLEVGGMTPTGLVSQDDDVFMPYASLMNPRPDDDPIVTAILKIRAFAKASSTHLRAYQRYVRADGCLHPSYNWTAVRTSRISADKPPVHQIPERSFKTVADAIKSCFIPRIAPAPAPEDWDPRKHGSVMRWDVDGAEAAIRGAMLPFLQCSQPDPIAYDYLRLGKDIHSKTASLLYGVPEGTFKKGSIERDAVGKQSFFAKIYGAGWFTLQTQCRTKARIFLTDQEAQALSAKWEAGYTGIMEMYERDKYHLGRYGYCEDGYGRRRYIGLPQQVRFRGQRMGLTLWDIEERDGEKRKAIQRDLEHRFHVAANSPTQSMSASDVLWMLAYLHLGEEDMPPLRVPAMWADSGVLFPEARGWRLAGGPGPGGKPFQAWHGNTVHDAGWLDASPGYVEPTMKLIMRRCTAIPFDWRLKADVPYRVSIQVGPDHGHLRDYNDVARMYNLEPMPKR